MFFQLSPPLRQSMLATWIDDEIEMDTIVCPLKPEHQHAGPRRSPLSVSVAGVAGDMVWTWYSECLFSEELVDLVRRERLTGLEFHPASVRGPSGAPFGRQYWEVAVRGWAGMATPESGIKLQYDCPECGHLCYSAFADASRLIDERDWDGSDFFMVWPLPKFIFVTQRVAQIFRRHRIGPCRFVHLAEVKSGSAELSPGRSFYGITDKQQAAIERILKEPKREATP